MTKLHIQNLPIQQLSSYHNALRKHPKEKITKLAKLINEYGFLIPILVDEKTNTIVAGEARYLAAKRLKFEEVPVTRVNHLNAAQLKAFRIADNKMSEGSKWDLDVLKLELLELEDVGFDLSLTAFELPEIDLLMLDNEQTSADDEEVPTPPAISYLEQGDVFKVASHILICGDCRDTDMIKRGIGDIRADIVVSDPPYNVKVNGHVLSNDSVHDEFAMASGEMSPSEFTAFLESYFRSACQLSKDGSIHAHFMDHHHAKEILDAGAAIYDKRLNICVWNKTNAGMGSFYRSQHELCFIFKNGTASHTNNIQLGKFGRHRSNIWCYPGMNTFAEEREQLLASHPTVKNTEMIADILLDASHPGDIVLDGFLGSGTTLIAAEKTGRVCIGIEIEPKYIEVAIKRFQAISDEPVMHKESGLSYDALIKKRQENNHE